MNDLPEPPLAGFPTACSQMHDHDPIDCAAETLAKTIDVPVPVLLELIETVGTQFKVEAEFHAFFGTVIKDVFELNGPAGAYRLTLETAVQLLCRSYALGCYGLDECAEATYEHPAVKAEITLQQLLEEQYPEEYERLSSAYYAAAYAAIGN